MESNESHWRYRAAGTAGCMRSSDAANPYNPGSGSPPAVSASLKLASNAKFGNYLVDGNGRTLYLFALDLPAGGGNPALSNCTAPPATRAPASTSGRSSTLPTSPSKESARPTSESSPAAPTACCRRPTRAFLSTTSAGRQPGDVGGEAIPDWFVLRSPFYTIMTLNAGGKHRLTDGAGRSLYFFAQDTVGNPPTSACAGTAGDRTTCVGNWPIFLGEHDGGAQQHRPREDHDLHPQQRQPAAAAFDGHPLYYFADDKVPGDDLD